MNTSELLKYFIKNYPDLTKDMMNTLHSKSETEINPYHIENSVWTHTLLVLQRAENLSIVNKVAALLHDIGKTKARDVKDDKVRFFGHEGLSAMMSIGILNDMENDEIVSKDQKEQIFKIISLHGVLFNHIKDNRIINFNKILDKFIPKYKLDEISEDFKKEPNNIKITSKFKPELDLYDMFLKQIECDSTGRFFEKSSDNVLESISSDKITALMERITERCLLHKERKTSNTFTMMIGIPGSGKSTYLKNTNSVLSRDEILMDYADAYYNAKDYNDAWDKLSEKDQNEINYIFELRFKQFKKDCKDFTIDMTNMSTKSRRKWLGQLGKNYYKKAVVMCTDLDVIKDRLSKREGKKISDDVLDSMMKRFIVPMYDEFDEVELIFS